MAAALPAFHRFETQPPLAAYQPSATDATRCVARRTDEDHCDRRWAPFVYAAYQCKNMPVATGAADLCEVCRRRETKGTIKAGWNGRVTEELPTDSHIAGSEWFLTKAKWVGDEKRKTRRMEERADERRLVADVEIRRFLAGAVPLNIERLTSDNQITSQQLRDMVCRLTEKPIGSDRINGYDKKEKLCELIRTLMGPAVTAGEAPKFTVHYPKANGGAGAASAPASAPASVNTAEEDATAAELIAKDAEIAEISEHSSEMKALLIAERSANAELRAQIAALQSKLTKVSIALDD